MKKILIVILIMSSLSIYSAPKSDLWNYWQKSDNTNNTKINHDQWSVFLSKYIKTNKGLNLVDYKSVNKKDLQDLNSYINSLENLSISKYNKVNQKVYWINLYNALTVKIILDNYPVNSILDIKLSGLFKVGPWDKKLLTIEGNKVSLNDIEHRILRPIWKDKRIHFALNCASIGCPELQTTAFTVLNVEELLKRSEQNFIQSPRGLEVTSKSILLSSIFKWYSVDFGKNESQILEYLSRIKGIELSTFKGKKVKYQYNWDLNEYQEI